MMGLEGRPLEPAPGWGRLPPAASPSLLPASEGDCLQDVQARVDAALRELLELPDEAGLDARWTRVLERVREYALRPAKRVRPALLVVGYALGGGSAKVPDGLWRFAAGLELLHTFMLIHDDVADQAELRRGGPALHRLLAPGRAGEDQAVVVGDHLFSLAVEALLSSGLPGASTVTRYYLGVCRHTAAGQYLDLDLARTPLAGVSLFQTLRVARLKTARYGFCAPLVCGARLGGADPALVERLDKVGRHLGLAYQLRDDIIGLFGDPRLSGKPVDSDFAQGKRTFPLLAAHRRASPEARAELEALWALPPERKDEAALLRARALVESWGGLQACEGLVERASHTARRSLRVLPDVSGTRALLDALITRLERRAA